MASCVLLMTSCMSCCMQQPRRTERTIMLHAKVCKMLLRHLLCIQAVKCFAVSYRSVCVCDNKALAPCLTTCTAHIAQRRCSMHQHRHSTCRSPLVRCNQLLDRGCHMNIATAFVSILCCLLSQHNGRPCTVLLQTSRMAVIYPGL